MIIRIKTEKGNTDLEVKIGELFEIELIPGEKEKKDYQQEIEETELRRFMRITRKVRLCVS